jgi:hypothetical protein
MGATQWPVASSQLSGDGNAIAERLKLSTAFTTARAPRAGVVVLTHLERLDVEHLAQEITTMLVAAPGKR